MSRLLPETNLIRFLLRLGRCILTPPYQSFRQKAEEFCKRELHKDPKNTSSMWFLGNLYLWYEEYGLAKGPLESLLTQRKNHRGGKLLLSRVYFHQQDHEGVKRILTPPGVLSERDAENYYLGYSLSQLGEYREATKFLGTYAAHHQSDYQPFTALGYAQFMAGAYGDALESYKMAAKLNPLSIEIKDSIELCQRRLGE